MASLLIPILLLAARTAFAETHTITFVNNCGAGSIPQLIHGDSVLSTGQPYTVQGKFPNARAYLQQGTKCLFNGENCTVVEITLQNATPGVGDGSSVNLSLIPPLAYNVKTSFRYTKGCSSGATCGDPNCNTAFHISTDTFTQVACQEPDNSIEITFC
ncbi:hypothetical protein MKEN_00561200 [Mycena kentingensis (nom. inval.)]|nr:hypothetical protein MKEN_00561200 [Mycena kentingensis (nom. inval.)]